MLFIVEKCSLDVGEARFYSAINSSLLSAKAL